MPRSDSSTSMAPVIAGTGTGLPGHAMSQARALELLLAVFELEPPAIQRWLDAAGVDRRYLALPPDAYHEPRSFAESNRTWIEVALQIGERAVREALADAELEPEALGLLATTTVTGLAIPTIDARLMNTIEFAPTLRRIPMFGLGCVGGAAGVARVAEYLRGHPDQTAMLLSVELCSLTLQNHDGSIANQIASALFGDGAAAVLVAGAEHPLAARAKPQVLDSRSTSFPNTERMMGFDLVDSGFQLVLSPEVPDLVERELPALVDDFLAEHELVRADIDAWIAHPGGPKVIRALQRGLGLDDEQVAVTKQTLSQYGNMSSASVLFVLDEIRRRAPAPGSYGLLFALGPAFCAELVLLRW